MAEPLKLMVIEDEELLLGLIARKLKTNNITAYTYKSAEEGLDHFIQKKGFPDLVWLDYRLKGMNGLEFINKLRNDLNITKVPIVVISNEANDDVAKKCLAAGAVKFWVKAQISLEEALLSINTYLSEESKKIK